MSDLTPFVVAPASTLREVMSTIDRNGVGVALVVDSAGRLLATITDGDLRRAILGGIDLDVPASTLLSRFDPARGGKVPLTLPVGTPDAQVLRVMVERVIRHVPIVDAEGRLVELKSLPELTKEYERPLQAVIMAGGLGTRLRPLTDNVPKPMLPVGQRPLLERMLEQLKQAGVTQVNVTTHYKADVITEHFGDGKAFGVDIRYVREDQPLGTAGALGLMEAKDDPVLVINGDILTRVNFRALRDFHREHRADMTVCVRQYDLKVPYGVVESDGVVVTGIVEKPLLRHFVSAGIYLLDPGVTSLVAAGERCDMPDLIRRLIADRKRVVSFPISEYWMDIGQLADYEQAKSDLASGRLEP